MESKNDWFEDLLQQVNEAIESKRFRVAHPYVRDLIEVLLPHPGGLRRPLVMHTLERLRKQRGLPIPEKFEQSVRSTYNHHSVASAVFRKRNAPEIDGIFFSPGGKGSGVWAVNRDRAEAWLRARLGDHS